MILPPWMVHVENHAVALFANARGPSVANRAEFPIGLSLSRRIARQRGVAARGKDILHVGAKDGSQTLFGEFGVGELLPDSLFPVFKGLAILHGFGER